MSSLTHRKVKELLDKKGVRNNPKMINTLINNVIKSRGSRIGSRVRARKQIKDSGKIKGNNDKLFARLLQITYKKRRPQFVNYKGDKFLEYKPNKSTELYAHYEDNKNIIVSYHGVNSIRSALKGVRDVFLSSKVFKNACKKYEKTLDTNKNVWFLGHSLGASILQNCYYNIKKHNQIVTFAGFSNIKNIKRYAKNKDFRKILFKNDPVSNGILKIKGRKNVKVLTPKFGSEEFIKLGHNIKFFIN